MADSRLFVGGIPVALISKGCVSVQSLLVAISVPFASRSESVGLGTGAATPASASEGPRPRTKIFPAPFPPAAITPAIIRLSPFWTYPRELMLARVALAVGDASY